MIDLEELKHQKEYKKFVEEFRKENIPERYNQIYLMDELLNENIAHFISISNRSDGKSFNYLNFLISLSIEFNIGFCLIARHYTVRAAYQRLLEEIIDKSKKYKPRHFAFIRRDFYYVLLYQDKEIAIITDLNQATDLKYESQYINKFPVMVYDEFLAIEGDYLPDEWVRLKTIFSSIDRDGERKPIIKFPKVLYLGNAVNFSSPVLASLDLFNILEAHPMNTMKQYGKLILEVNKNDSANEERNLWAFDEENDDLTKAEFYINKHNIATDNDKQNINKEPKYIYIKLDKDYLKITYNAKTYKTLLTIVSFIETGTTYDFNLLLKDNNEKSVYLDESFFDEKHYKKYNKNIFLFENMYSKDYIIDTFTGLRDLKIFKVIKKYQSINKETPFELREKRYKENDIERSKKALFRRFMQ